MNIRWTWDVKSVGNILELWMSHQPNTQEQHPWSRGHQGSRRWASSRRLRRRDRRTAARAAIEIGDTTGKRCECQWNYSWVEETVPCENAENTEKSGNIFRVSEISFFTLAVWTRWDYKAWRFFSDKEQSGAGKVNVVAFCFCHSFQDWH